MTPSSSTSQPRQLTLLELPHPTVLPTHHDVVRTGMGLGLPAIEELQEPKEFCCPSHRLLFIPVEAGPAGVRSRMRSARTRPCAERRFLEVSYA